MTCWYEWKHAKGKAKPFPRHKGNFEAAEIIGDGSLDAFNQVADRVLDTIARVFSHIDLPYHTS